MLELRPTCENCDKTLAPDSPDARICSYECTFCVDCVQQVLENVCPNCGGGFVVRPIRPAVHLGDHPPSTMRVHKPVDRVSHAKLIAELIDELADIPPHRR